MRTELLGYISHFKKFYTQVFSAYADKYGLSQLEIDVLLFLYNNPELNTVRDISEMRGLAKSNVSNAVEILRGRGYLNSEPDPESRKIKRLSISDKMLGRAEELAACQTAGFARALRGFTEEERELWNRFARRIDLNIQEALREREEGKEKRK